MAWEKGRARIDRVVARVAYARNGNVGNASVEYRWELFVDGRLVLSCGKLRDAKAEAGNRGQVGGRKDRFGVRQIIFPNGGSYLWGALAGPANAAKRQAVMRACGVEMPKAKCGYHAVEKALVARYGIDDSMCPSRQHEAIVAAMNAEAAPAAPGWALAADERQVLMFA